MPFINNTLFVIELSKIPPFRSFVLFLSIVKYLSDKCPTDIILSFLSEEIKPLYRTRFYSGDFKRDVLSDKVRTLYFTMLKEKQEDKQCSQQIHLHITNISSSIDISANFKINHYLDLLGRLLGCFDVELPKEDSVIPFYLYNYEILLKKPEDMPTYEEMWDIERIGNENYFPPEGTTVLGYYTRKNEDGVEGPHIVLCPESIENTAKEGWGVEFLYCIVYIHELAHALMDKYEDYSYRISDNKLSLNENDIMSNWPKSLYTISMEESLANMIMLQVFRITPYFKEALDFVRQQPVFYQLGIRQEKENADWRKWRNSKKEDTDNLKEWFRKCFGNNTYLEVLMISDIFAPEIVETLERK